MTFTTIMIWSERLERKPAKPDQVQASNNKTSKQASRWRLPQSWSYQKDWNANQPNQTNQPTNQPTKNHPLASLTSTFLQDGPLSFCLLNKKYMCVHEKCTCTETVWDRYSAGAPRTVEGNNEPFNAWVDSEDDEHHHHRMSYLRFHSRHGEALYPHTHTFLWMIENTGQYTQAFWKQRMQNTDRHPHKVTVYKIQMDEQGFWTKKR